MTTPASATRARRRAELQFGHSVAAVDDGERVEHNAVAQRSFNSATASPPWMTSGNFYCGTNGTSFNSATASPPWMTSFTVAGGSITFGLQFGHSVAAVDDDGAPSLSDRLVVASIRPQRRRRG